jgi:hypothetical protein
VARIMSSMNRWSDQMCAGLQGTGCDGVHVGTHIAWWQGQFMATLIAELANNDKPAQTRQLAGLVCKNALDSKARMGTSGTLWGLLLSTSCPS